MGDGHFLLYLDYTKASTITMLLKNYYKFKVLGEAGNSDAICIKLDIDDFFTIDTLTKREKAILYNGFMLGYPQEEIAQRFNINQATVSRVLKSGVNKITYYNYSMGDN